MRPDGLFVLQPGELIIYYELEEGESSSSRGIVEVCPDTHRWAGRGPVAGQLPRDSTSCLNGLLLSSQDHPFPGEASGRPDGVPAGQRGLLLRPQRHAVPPVRLPPPADGGRELRALLGV